LGLTQPWQIPEQVHGHRVGRAGDTALCQTDAMALFTPDIPVMLLFADCVPILLYDPVTHSGAVIHAGWRGTAQNIVQEAILTFQNAKGVKPQDIRAVIGPAISLCCFQVSLTVAQQLGASLDQELEALTQKGLIVWDEAFPENPRVNLKAINAAQLEAFGVKHCDVLPQCTYCEAEQLFSFRRGEDGRNSAYMMLKSK
jgi:YfiH family protein